MTTPLSGSFVIHRRLGVPMVNQLTTSEDSLSINYEDIKGDTKCRQWAGLW